MSLAVLDPADVHGLDDDALAADIENVVRWTLAATDPQRVPRPNTEARLAMLRAALGDAADGDDGEFLVRTVLLLTSPMAWLYWKDYLGLDPADTAATAGWAIRALTRAR